MFLNTGTLSRSAARTDGESGNDGAPRNLFFMLADQVSESDEGDDAKTP